MRIGRTARALSLALALIALWAAFGPRDSNITDYERHGLKHYWNQCSDVVVAGDSTVSWTMDPTLIEDRLSGLRVDNFGYENVAFTPSYLDAIGRVLDPASPAPVVVIAFSPFNTTLEGPLSRWGFAAEMTKTMPLTLGRTREEELTVRLRTRPLCSALWGACDSRFFISLGPHGFTPTYRQPYDPEFLVGQAAMALKMAPAYSQYFLVPLYDHIKAWRAQGIRVFGFLVPRSPVVVGMMKEQGYSSQGMLVEFIRAGGVLLETPQVAATFDGLHLTPEAAATLTDSIGDQIARKLGPITPPSSPGKRCPWPE